MDFVHTFSFRSPVARRILTVGLPIILCYLLYILFYLESGKEASAIGLQSEVLTMLEHVLLSLTLLVGGSCLFDLADREKKET